ncbi:MAG TPA: amidase [Noviherbaspirillum sp.]|jgi:Asp-tRNA(Asn)/Glu-tRNA(Gln) amidotransferase A subunit family amidase|uniref:amidase n=1 Tax=Noviherbaspirillum sp. TaxID=1926288 RepID=UPI002DDD1512|nr:amidase [Noviherbaspirillum sp.]HEV2610805.1 amidase [Noviherbaspirillum sp.]
MTNPISTPITNLASISRAPLIEQCIAHAETATAVFTRLYPEAARVAASHADAMHAAGVRLSPLAGLPVSVKDLFDVAGETTLAGSVVLKERLPAQSDAPVVARLRQAGAAILGKTNMTEFAFSGVGLNPHYGTPANPADTTLARIPGGSSSGAAVSVAAGLCVAGLGSDTGGSIRIPAALCGIVGFKPTARRVPSAGAIPLSTTLDTICAMTRSVADCVTVDDVIADDTLSVREIPLRGLRLMVPSTVVLDTLEPHVAASFSSALSRLSAAGAAIIETPLAPLTEAAELNRFSGAESYTWHRDVLAARESDYDARVAKRIKTGIAMSAADYIDLHRRRRDWIARMEQALAPYDALIMPTVPVVAPEMAPLEVSEETFFHFNGLLLRNTSTINLLDGCAISMPCHAQGTLPVGLSVAGPAMSDARILAVALAIERALTTP